MKRKTLGAGAALSLLALVLAGCTAGGVTPDAPTGGGGNGTVPGGDGCTPVVVATSSEKINLMEELGAGFKESPQADSLDGCATIFPINVASGLGSDILSANPTAWEGLAPEYYPTIWSPASTVWTDRVTSISGNQKLVADAQSFTQTPVVFGMPESMADALGYPDKPVSINELQALITNPEGWGVVGKGLWGDFKLAKTNPNTSTTGLSILLMQAYAATGKTADLTVADVDAARDFSQAFEAGAIHYGDTTGRVLKNLYADTQSGATGSNYVSAIALEETSLFNYNKGNPDSHVVQPGEVLTPPDEKLIAIYPSGGSMWSDNPAVVLGSSWVTPEQRAAGEKFLEYLQTPSAQSVLPKYGFRPVDASVDASAELNANVGISLEQPTVTLPKPDAQVVSAAKDQWEVIRKPSAVLELIDLSGSMDDSIGDGLSRLDGAIMSAKDTLGHFRNSDEVGVWAFTTGITSEHGNNVYPLREVEPLTNGREKLNDSIEDLKNAQRGGTPLYDAISIGYDYMNERAEAGRINALVVLSDGEDFDSSTSLESLMQKLNADTKEGGNASRVRIFTISYGDDSPENSAILERIAKATGGQHFSASDPAKINSVFASVINNF
jgi:Ca-activated chloride channel family protein